MRATHTQLLEEFKTAGRFGEFNFSDISNAFEEAGASLEEVGRAPLRSDSSLCTKQIIVTYDGQTAPLFFLRGDKNKVQGAQGLKMYNILNSILASSPA